MERCLHSGLVSLREEDEHADEVLLGRWLRFGGVSALRLRNPAGGASLRGRAALPYGLVESLEHCLKRAGQQGSTAPSESAAETVDPIRDIAVCVSSARFRCPKEPP